ncbi:prolipoprotein diacylglyceryl transferase [Microaerobacter geothermalis]|uniref:prolipoprotein diacylglyceryl transferase n=1 Tax=Microaerobacter geothermalis TaxID=674972 RepID=UPI001F360C90|nr:prolipoprotein diacylglyceryl transferase [Microaerobacter geothermalis]MCF6093044.1 prolipoprotein diacylglyceryl transferase [Microaerobacter geothermalis]
MFPGPVLFKIGPLPIHTLGVMIALAALVGMWMITRTAKKEGINPDYMVDLTVYAMIGGIIGARLWYVVFMWQNYVDNPIEIFMVWMGGLAIQGGILGGAIAGIWYARKRDLPVWHVSDIVAPALILGMAIGRIGDFLTGDAYGIPSSSIFAVTYPPGTLAYSIYGDVSILPMPLFEAIGDVIIMGILLWVKKRKPFEGFLFLAMLALYSLSRFTMEFWRGDSLRTIFDLKVAQLTAIATILIAIGFMIYRMRQEKKV